VHLGRGLFSLAWRGTSSSPYSLSSPARLALRWAPGRRGGRAALNLVVIVIAIGMLNGERVELFRSACFGVVLRVINLSFAVIPTATCTGLVVIYGVMFIPILSVVAHRKLSRHDLGFTGGRRLRYLIPFGTLIGVELGLSRYQILANPPSYPHSRSSGLSSSAS